MTKSELIAALMQKHPHLQLKDINLIVNTVFDSISTSLADNNRVELRGFGAFSIKERDLRIGRNPKSGEKVQASKKYILFFKTGKDLHARINKARKA